MTLLWYIKRLAAMPAGEIVFRIGFTFTRRLWKRAAPANRAFSGLGKPIVSMPSRPLRIEDPPDSKASRALIEEADAYLRHEWRFFGLKGVSEKTIDWHFDPVSQRTAPLKFSYDIDHRDYSTIGDPKIIWEKNRHHHLTVMAAAFALTGNEDYSKEVADQILDWIEKNPCLVGINWSHPLELGIRLISWTWCERLLRGSIHYDRAFGISSPFRHSVVQHQEIIARAYSRGSSANNHLIGEMAGLFIASVSLPFVKKARAWAALSKHILEREIVHQTFPSGINRELAFEYHLFVAEFFLLALYEGDASGFAFSNTYCNLLKKILEAIPMLTDAGGNLPRYGDGDNGMALQLYARGEPRTRWLLQAREEVPLDDPALPLLFMRATRELLAKDAIPEFKFLWKSPPKALSGLQLKAESGRPHNQFTEASSPGTAPELKSRPQGDQDDIPAINKKLTNSASPTSLAFADAGIYILSSNRHGSDEVFLLADAGPLGFGSLAAHGHADALSFTLSVGGRQIFIDSGTYSYYSDRRVRGYFRGTRSHNTLLVDERDQSKPESAFLWSDKATTKVIEWQLRPLGGLLTAEHNGYARSLGVTHRRTLTLDGKFVRIIDRLSGSGEHLIQLCFHCAPACTIESDSNHCLCIASGDRAVMLTLPEGFDVSISKANSTGGWYSPRFGIKIPSYSIFASARCALPLSFTSFIEVTHER